LENQRKEKKGFPRGSLQIKSEGLTGMHQGGDSLKGKEEGKKGRSTSTLTGLKRKEVFKCSPQTYANIIQGAWEKNRTRSSSPSGAIHVGEKVFGNRGHLGNSEEVSPSNWGRPTTGFDAPIWEKRALRSRSALKESAGGPEKEE